MKLSSKLLSAIVLSLFVLPALVLTTYAIQPETGELKGRRSIEGATSQPDDGIDNRTDVGDSDTLATVASNPEGSADRKLLLFASNRTGNYEIFLINADGTYLKNLTNNPAEDSAPGWSTDGKKIAFVSNRGGDRNIYVMNADGSNVRQLTTYAGRDREPVWSPDGTKIAFSRHVDFYNWEVFVMDADGANQINLTNHPDRDSGPTWSPDGKQIAFSSNRFAASLGRRGPFNVHVMDADGDNVRMLSDRWTLCTFAAWSPDGKKIAYGGLRSPADVEICVYDFDNGNEAQLTTLGQGGRLPARSVYPVWTPDGKRIAFQHFAGSIQREADDLTAFSEPGILYIMDADGTNLNKVVTGVTYLGFGGGQPGWKPN